MKEMPTEELIRQLRATAAIWFKDRDLLMLEELIQRLQFVYEEWEEFLRVIARVAERHRKQKVAMTGNEHRAKCIGAMKKAFLATAYTTPTQGDSIVNISESLEAAFDALHGIASVNPPEAMEEFCSPSSEDQ